MTRFWLIRHGSTPTLDHSIAGWTPHVPLSERGRAEVQALCARLASSPARRVYASPLQRAQETGQLLATRLGCELDTCEGLGELRYGEWTGLTFDALQRDERFASYNRFRSGSTIPGGESLLSAQARAVGALLELRAVHPGEELLLVTHSDVIKAVVMHFLGIALDFCHRLEIAPASLTGLELGPDFARVVTLNDTAHL